MNHSSLSLLTNLNEPSSLDLLSVIELSFGQTSRHHLGLVTIYNRRWARLDSNHSHQEYFRHKKERERNVVRSKEKEREKCREKQGERKRDEEIKRKKEYFRHKKERERNVGWNKKKVRKSCSSKWRNKESERVFQIQERKRDEVIKR